MARWRDHPLVSWLVLLVVRLGLVVIWKRTHLSRFQTCLAMDILMPGMREVNHPSNIRSLCLNSGDSRWWGNGIIISNFRSLHGICDAGAGNKKIVSFVIPNRLVNGLATESSHQVIVPLSLSALDGYSYHREWWKEDKTKSPVSWWELRGQWFLGVRSGPIYVQSPSWRFRCRLGCGVGGCHGQCYVRG